MLVKNEQILAFPPKFPHTSFETLGKLVKQTRFREEGQWEGAAPLLRRRLGATRMGTAPDLARKKATGCKIPSA
jgi:hypothetical protein